MSESRTCPKCGFVKECESDLEKGFIKLILENNELLKRVEKLEEKENEQQTN